MILIVAGVGAYAILPRDPGPGPGMSVAASPAPAASPSARPTRAPSVAPAPARTLGDWQATSDHVVGDIVGPDEPIQLSVDWQDGLHTWIQTPDGGLAFKSETLDAPPDEIHVLTPADPDARGCEVGQLGRYRWARSADGMFLTLTLIEDECPLRGLAMARTWIHSLSAVTDGGLGVMSIGSAWLKATLPNRRFGLTAFSGVRFLHSIDAPDRTLVAMEDPMGLDAPCSYSRNATAIPNTTAGYVSYVRRLPRFTVSTADATVAGMPAVHVTLAPKAGAACAAVYVVAFHGSNPDEVDADLVLVPSKSHSLWIVPGHDHMYVFIYEGDDLTAGDESSVISSLEFLDALPAP
jgi:hypothetical protein